ncbi:MAG: hypothetical protein A2015_15235 [Spirochaetes bacterium GWF1_31_7]|nr:MAG: hypothetical protein A2Y30_11660 [Spirochaetes bacterium GWE1_32_154]OHD51174.1 MAG: hypothetical protein A2Y29_01200 [Spirochaetes bacterium GWE2_31_10]OHD52093.1 MAG: hypothetical protein A2015_15235 [Spirochaetes bacterium GWF1_31_7]OHD81036.1 MAG: hypothetical protein A2355_11200 [Spirochaetes bacterium RIFOXYB1_FULL_32_8]HBD93266.1 Cof-type HAD-IIB family hydrolase [Spirochaetia bacterium]
MPIKLIAMDIDDTLLNNKMKITFRNRLAIKRAAKKGIHIALASGRPTGSMIEIAKQLGIEKTGYIISFNGASILELSTGKNLYQSAVNKELAHELIDLSKEHDVYIHTYLDNHIITEKRNKYTEIESEITGLSIREVSSLKDMVTQSVVKLLMLENPDRLKIVESQLKSRIGDRLSMYISKPFFLEFMGAGTDKGNSLSILADILNIKQNEVMAIGDSYNDQAMIEWAGVGVAMDNANADIKKIADHITGHHNKSGVAEAINKFCFAK